MVSLFKRYKVFVVMTMQCSQVIFKTEARSEKFAEKP